MTEGSELTSPEEGEDINPEEGRAIIETQIELIKRLNDELLRTIRLHVAFGGIVVAAVSFIGIDSLIFSEGTLVDVIAYTIYTLLAILFGLFWLIRLMSARLSYTNLLLGVWPGASYSESSELRREKNGIWGMFKEGISVIRKVLNPGFVGLYENEFDRGRVNNELLGPDYQTCIKHNNWILKTREVYVNKVQSSLNILLLMTVGCLIGVMVS